MGRRTKEWNFKRIWKTYPFVISGINMGNVLLESRYYCSKRNIFDKLSLSTKNNIKVVQHHEKKVT
jgi:hypothetical protein